MGLPREGSHKESSVSGVGMGQQDHAKCGCRHLALAATWSEHAGHKSLSSQLVSCKGQVRPPVAAPPGLRGVCLECAQRKRIAVFSNVGSKHTAPVRVTISPT